MKIPEEPHSSSLHAVVSNEITTSRHGTNVLSKSECIQRNIYKFIC